MAERILRPLWPAERGKRQLETEHEERNGRTPYEAVRSELLVGRWSIVLLRLGVRDLLEEPVALGQLLERPVDVLQVVYTRTDQLPPLRRQKDRKLTVPEANTPCEPLPRRPSPEDMLRLQAVHQPHLLVLSWPAVDGPIAGEGVGEGDDVGVLGGGVIDAGDSVVLSGRKARSGGVGFVGCVACHRWKGWRRRWGLRVACSWCGC